MKSRCCRSLLFLLVCLAVVPLRAADDALEPLPADVEPMGFGFALPSALHADATRLLAAEKSGGLFDPGARFLADGQPVHAFAEALRAEKSPDPALKAASHVRRALILARLGAPDFAAAHANEAVAVPSVRGELHLARAWVLWQRARFEPAGAEARLAATAPAWALAEWQAFQAAHAAAASRFAAAAEPTDDVSPEYLAYVQLALDAGAVATAEDLNSRAIRHLQEQRDAEPGTDPARLQRATRLRRDIHAAALGSKPDPAAAVTWQLYTDAARGACDVAPTRDDWVRLLAAWTTAQASIPDFNFAGYNVHGDLLAAERLPGFPETWRQQLKPLLNDPRQRYASRLQQALTRLEADPIVPVLEEFFDEPAAPALLAQLDAALARLEPDTSALERLRAALPAGSAPVPGENAFLQRSAELRFRQALAHGDAATARPQLALLRELADKPGTPALATADYIAALLNLERQPLLRFIAELDAKPLEAVPGEATDKALVQALLFEGQIRQAQDKSHPAPGDYRPAELRALQAIQHLRVLVACARGNVLAAEDALAALEKLRTDDDATAYPALARCVKLVATLPVTAQLHKEDVAVAAVELSVVDYAGEDEEDLDAPTGLPDLALQAAARWQNGDFAAGDAELARLKARVIHNPYAKQFLADTEQRFSPTARLAAARTAFDAAPATNRAAATRALAEAADQVLNLIDTRFSRSLFDHPEKIPAPYRPLVATAAFDYVRAAAAAGQTYNACYVHELLTRYGAPADRVAASLALVAGLPFTNDLPTPEARDAWSKLPSFNWYVPPDQAKFSAAFDAAADRSITARLGQIICRTSKGPNPAAQQVITTFRRRFGINRAAAAQLAVIERHLERLTQLGAEAATSIKADLRERQRYANSRAQTIADINGKNAEYQQKMQAIAADARRLTAELDGVSPSLGAVDAVSSRLDEINSSRAAIEQRAAGAWTEYEQRDQQRRLAFLDEAARKISEYNQSMARTREQYDSVVKDYPRVALLELAPLTGAGAN